jgi:Leucine-rich repeat (LRR) protein
MDDIIYTILTFLYLDDLLVCTLVNKKFYIICKEQMIWKNLIESKYKGINQYETNYYETFKMYYILEKFIGKNLDIKHLWKTDTLFVNKSKIIIPTQISCVKNLSTISLVNNYINHIPAEFGQLSNLKVCILSMNKISTLPTEMGKLHNLNKLYLYDNMLDTIPKEICELPNLKMLNVSDNYISKIPTHIGNLTSLTKLFLHGNNSFGSNQNQYQYNKFKTVPSSLGNLCNLKVLALQNCNNVALPSELNNLQKLRTISLSKCQDLGPFINLQHALINFY